MAPRRTATADGIHQEHPPEQHPSWLRAANTPVLFWMCVVILIGLAHFALPDGRWLLVHVITLGILGNSFLIWGRRLTEAAVSLRTHSGNRNHHYDVAGAFFDLPEALRILLYNAGLIAMIAGALSSLTPVTAIGATGVGSAAALHALTLARHILIRRNDQQPAAEERLVVFLTVGAFLLPFSAVLDVVLAAAPAGEWYSRLLLAHEALMILGVLGLSLTGMLLLCAPSILVDPAPDAPSRPGRVSDSLTDSVPRALALHIAGCVGAVGGALTGWAPVAAAALAVYLLGWLLVTIPFVASLLRNRRPGFAAWSSAFSLPWFVVVLGALILGLLTEGITTTATHWITLPLLVGFALPLLFGLMSHLVPSARGDDPAAVYAAVNRLNVATAWRVTTVNLGLLLWLLPVGSVTRVFVSFLVCLALALFLPLLAPLTVPLAAPLRMRAGRTPTSVPRPHSPSEELAMDKGASSRPWGTHALAAVACLALAVALAPQFTALGGSGRGLGGASSASGPGAGSVAPTGHTTEVTVTAKGMRFVPDTIEVPAGDELVIHVDNQGEDVHDLVLATGAETGRITPGETGTLNAGVIGSDIEGWCSIVGHRAQGMVFHVKLAGGSASTQAQTPGADDDAMAHHHHGADDSANDASGPAATIDLSRSPDKSFQARDARLPRAPRGSVHRYTFEVSEGRGEVAPGVEQAVWTYVGTPGPERDGSGSSRLMGPVLRGKVGDTFEITVLNKGSMTHSIDFHAGMVSPTDNMGPIQPGETFVYRFRAEHSGIWLYHCGTAPMSVHMSAGMFGAVIVDPPDLAPVDAEYIMVQSEAYLAADGEVSPAKIKSQDPDLVMFNGYAHQYVYRPLRAKVADRIRIWVLDAGPSVPLAFHVVGTQFDTVYREGAYLLRPDRGDGRDLTGGSQVLSLHPAEGGFAEMTFLEPGDYAMVNHRFVDAERGAKGLIHVTR